MVLHNPNNWHWVNKDASEWTREWFKQNLLTLEATDGDVTAKISSVQSMDGDVDVSQRKGKVITIFDVKLVLEYSGSAPDAADVSGNITVPEIAHDTEEDEYVFDIELFAESKEKQPVKDLVKKKLVPEMRKIFQGLAPALIGGHSKDIQHAAGVNPSSGFSTAKVHPDKQASKAAGSTSQETKTGGIVNTTTVTDTEEFRTPAEEAYKTFVEPARIAAFTRSPPKVFEGAHKGGKFELFGGNVSGEYIELDEPKKIVQSWRLNQWPAGHYSTLKIEFDQNDVDHVTVMRVTWEGVPVGQEDVTKQNWRQYYVDSIKRTFGFGTIL